MRKLLFFFLTSLVLIFILSGCVTVKTNNGSGGNSATNGGIFKSANKGTLWQQKVLIPTISGRPAHIAGLDSASLIIDPSDNKTLYFGSAGSGLFYTIDGGETWQSVKGMGQGAVRAIAVDYNDKCNIYAAVGNRVLKSADCTRTWTLAYVDNEATVTVDAIAVDPYNNSLVYIGVSRGDIIKSSDGGSSWKTLNRAQDKIKRIIVDPNDTKVIYAATPKKGILRTSDGGNNWTDDINKGLKDIKIGTVINNIILVKSELAGVYVATENGLAHSTDRGNTWTNINILPPENKAKINDMAVNPKNTKEIYYVSDTTFFRSTDGGANWSTIKLPTSRAGWILLIDPVEPNVIYMGVKSLAK